MSHQLNISYEGGRYSVTLDGLEIATALKAVDLDLNALHEPTATLTTSYGSFGSFRGQADVRLSDTTRQMLIGLGWTPPEPEGGAA